MNIHDKIKAGDDGKWHVRFEHTTIDKNERNFGTGTTIFWQTYQSGWDAVEGLIKYCTDKDIHFSDFDREAWSRYYSDYDKLLSRQSTMQEMLHALKDCYMTMYGGNSINIEDAIRRAKHADDFENRIISVIKKATE